MKHIRTATGTQRIFENMHTDEVKRLNKFLVQEDKILRLRLKRLSRSMLKHSYRPNGRLFHCTLRKAVG